MFYKPSCVEGILTCKDICGEKCTKECEAPHNGCSRGKLNDNFMFCPMAKAEEKEVELAYVTYKLIAEKIVKEGKQAYKKTEKIMTDMPISMFITKFVDDFSEYSKHEVESWFLNAVKNAAFSPGYMPSHAMRQVMDFAQNLQHDKRHEISEEYFHKAQSALAATVTGISTPIRVEEGSGDEPKSIDHILSQITSSDHK